MQPSRSVDEYINAAEYWQKELKTLRKILTSTPLQEDWKWGAPCYTAAGKNIVGMGAYKSYFGLWFFQGALLTDDHQVLINAQRGKTKALRQWRMYSAADIRPPIIKGYVDEAIRLAREGREIAPARKQPVVIPPELAKALQANQSVARAFEKLRLGLQREYASYISEAKRIDTKRRRIEKILPMITAGMGLNDRYRNTGKRNPNG